LQTLPKGGISATDIWKRFRADRRRTLLRDEVQRLRARVRQNHDGHWRWALRNVSLVAEPGESVGLVGPNGSGKSTLLKILTKVMYPYAGRVEVLGRVGALIDVRAGIHPDLTGRENIFVSGSLIGHDRRELARRFDEIVAFAELEDALDRQVKFYSSGMAMRLGFSIASSLDPDILLVDEALAVGDATFQQRCLERMRSLLSSGTTLVFVSHDLATVEATCRKAMWLHHGEVQVAGPVREVVAAYRRSIEEHAELASRTNDLVRLEKTEVSGAHGLMPESQEPLDVTIIVDSQERRSATLFLGISEGTANPIFLIEKDVHLSEGETEIRGRLKHLPLPKGRFYLWVGIFDVKGRALLAWHPAAHFDVSGAALVATPRAIVRLTPVYVQAEWEVERR
jgi:ABC-type polysaccharide/polyol phosphate transport system ATPase subunit